MTVTAKPIKKLKIAAIVLAVVLILLCGALAFAGNYLFNFAVNPDMEGGMLYSDGDRTPTTEAELWLDGESQDRWLTSRDGLELHALYVPQAAESHRYAVVCHGYGNCPLGMAGYARQFYDMGFSILLPAARAHELSGSEYGGMGWPERKDIVDWIGTIVADDPEAEIFLFGVSMGGATVMMVSGEELPANVKCIIEDCGYSSVWDEFALQLKDMFGLPTFPLLNSASLVCKLRAGYSFGEASAVKQLENATVPMLFIHGEEDTFVPYSMLDKVYDACASAEKEKLSVPGAAHAQSASTDPELYWGTITAFLEKYFEI
ncbi:MAG: alpha/beta hydrolase [Candidatus Enterenecus sp.]